ncbi:MAG: DUF2975 domain-containing protein [Pseudomonadota bacterium]
MQNRERIQRASRRLRCVLTGIVWLLPVINALIWIVINELPELARDHMLPYFVTLPLPVSARVMGFGVVMIPTGIAMAGVWQLVRLFGLYEQGFIFMPANVRCFRNLSRTLIWWFAAGIVSNSLLSVALTLHRPAGQRMITLGLGSSDLTALLLGSILAVIAWIMEEGRKLREEQDLTV